MTEEENKKYEEQRAKIEAMSEEEKMTRLDKLSTEIFIIANSFTENKMELVAKCLHESVNNLFKAQKILNGKIENKIPLDFIKSNFFIK